MYNYSLSQETLNGKIMVKWEISSLLFIWKQQIIVMISRFPSRASLNCSQVIKYLLWKMLPEETCYIKLSVNSSSQVLLLSFDPRRATEMNHFFLKIT